MKSHFIFWRLCREVGEDLCVAHPGSIMAHAFWADVRVPSVFTIIGKGHYQSCCCVDLHIATTIVKTPKANYVLAKYIIGQCTRVKWNFLRLTYKNISKQLFLRLICTGAGLTQLWYFWLSDPELGRGKGMLSQNQLFYDYHVHHIFRIIIFFFLKELNMDQITFFAFTRRSTFRLCESSNGETLLQERPFSRDK